MPPATKKPPTNDLQAAVESFTTKPQKETAKELPHGFQKITVKHRSAGAAEPAEETPEIEVELATSPEENPTPPGDAPGLLVTETRALSETVPTNDRDDYLRYKRTIHRGISDMLNAGLEIGKALKEIKTRELYRVKYKNFQQFCEGELDIAKSRAYELVRAAEVRELFSATAEIFVQPSNERQIRPLTGLKSDDALVAAWKRAEALAGDDPVTEKIVRTAVKQMTAPPPSQVNDVPVPTWRSEMITRFKGLGFERPFEQPLPSWPSDAAHLYSAGSKHYTRFIDQLTLEEAACAKALKQVAPESLIIVNANSNALDGFDPTPLDENTHHFPVEFDLMATEIGLHVEHKGIFYAPGELDDKFHAVWTPLSLDDLAELGLTAEVSE